MGHGARVDRIQSLPASGTTNEIVEVELADGSTRRLVLRRYHDAARLACDPWYVPAHEALALELLAGTPVPAPRLHAVDLEGRYGGAPALLESWMPGVPAWRPADLDAYIAAAAAVLEAIHAATVPPERGLPRYAPYHSRERLAPPRFSSRPELWNAAIATLENPWPAHRPTFIHRDYHPGNTLWDGSAVTGVVDWTTAAWGPAGVDLAHMRVNLAARFGRDAADRFGDAYVAAGGDATARHPYWDLLDAADLLPDIDAPEVLDGGAFAMLEDYVATVLEEHRIAR